MSEIQTVPTPAMKAEAQELRDALTEAFRHTLEPLDRALSGMRRTIRQLLADLSPFALGREAIRPSRSPRHPSLNSARVRDALRRRRR